MEVIYKKTMLQRIAEAQQEACRLGREIEKIKLSPREARLVLNEIGRNALFLGLYQNGFDFWLQEAELLASGNHPSGWHTKPQPIVKIMGAEIEVSW